MSLRELQTALGTMVVAQASTRLAGATWSESLEGLDLTVAERAWLAQLVGSPGFDVTCYVQRWWRGTGLGLTVRLTFAVLGPERGKKLLGRYLDTVPSSSIFFIPEALEFLDFVISEAPEIAHLQSIARFERARLMAAEAASLPSPPAMDLSESQPMQKIHRTSAADIVAFGATAERLLGALVMGEPLPPPDGRVFPILVAPGLPHLWRPATPDEERLWIACSPSSTLQQLLAVVDGKEQPILELLAMGAFGWNPEQDP